MAAPIELEGFFKRGSSWFFGMTRKDENLVAVDFTGLVTRAMFRVGGVDGELIVTLTEGAGITVDPLTGRIELKLNRTQTPLFAAKDKVYFDVEQTDPLDATYEWQSFTYFFKVEQQVTRDD
jgi:hypothetical protein